MGKIKLLFILALCFIGYKGFIAFKNFEIGVKERVENGKFEKSSVVVDCSKISHVFIKI